MSLQILTLPAGANGYEDQSPPVTTYPFCIGAWVRPYGVPANNISAQFASLGNSSVSRNACAIGMATSSNVARWVIAADNGTNFENVTTSNVLPSALTWAYVVGRWISSTNRRLSVWQNGPIEHITSASTITFSGATRATIGYRADTVQSHQPWQGLIAEIWFADDDIFNDSSSDLDNSLLMQLAYYGPLSVQYVAERLIAYKRFDLDNTTVYTGEKIGSSFAGKYGKRTWSPQGTVIADSNSPPNIGRPRGTWAPFIKLNKFKSVQKLSDTSIQSATGAAGPLIDGMLINAPVLMCGRLAR